MTIFYKFWKKARVYYTLSISRGGGQAPGPPPLDSPLGEPPPECTACECQLTIQHILVDCIEYDFIRLELFGNNTTLKDIFDNVSSDDIIMFINPCSAE